MAFRLNLKLPSWLNWFGPKLPPIIEPEQPQFKGIFKRKDKEKPSWFELRTYQMSLWFRRLKFTWHQPFVRANPLSNTVLFKKGSQEPLLSFGRLPIGPGATKTLSDVALMVSAVEPWELKAHKMFEGFEHYTEIFLNETTGNPVDSKGTAIEIDWDAVKAGKVKYRLVLPIEDKTAKVNMKALKHTIDFMDQFTNGGCHVHAHCKAGLGRSAMTIASYLVQHGTQGGKTIFEEEQPEQPNTQLTVEEAIVLLKLSRPITKIKAAQVSVARDLEAQPPPSTTETQTTPTTTTTTETTLLQLFQQKPLTQADAQQGVATLAQALQAFHGHEPIQKDCLSQLKKLPIKKIIVLGQALQAFNHFENTCKSQIRAYEDSHIDKFHKDLLSAIEKCVQKPDNFKETIDSMFKKLDHECSHHKNLSYEFQNSLKMQFSTYQSVQDAIETAFKKIAVAVPSTVSIQLDAARKKVFSEMKDPGIELQRSLAEPLSQLSTDEVNLFLKLSGASPEQVLQLRADKQKERLLSPKDRQQVELALDACKKQYVNKQQFHAALVPPLCELSDQGLIVFLEKSCATKEGIRLAHGLRKQHLPLQKLPAESQVRVNAALQAYTSEKICAEKDKSDREKELAAKLTPLDKKELAVFLYLSQLSKKESKRIHVLRNTALSSPALFPCSR